MHIVIIINATIITSSSVLLFLALLLVLSLSGARLRAKPHRVVLAGAL